MTTQHCGNSGLKRKVESPQPTSPSCIYGGLPGVPQDNIQIRTYLVLLLRVVVLGSTNHVTRASYGQHQGRIRDPGTRRGDMSAFPASSRPTPSSSTNEWHTRPGRDAITASTTELPQRQVISAYLLARSEPQLSCPRRRQDLTRVAYRGPRPFWCLSVAAPCRETPRGL